MTDPAAPTPDEPTPDVTPTPDAPVWSRARRITVVVAGILFFVAGISAGIVATQAEDSRDEEMHRAHHAYAMHHSPMQSPAFVADVRAALARDGIRVDERTLRAALYAACRDVMARSHEGMAEDEHMDMQRAERMMAAQCAVWERRDGAMGQPADAVR